MFWSRFITIVLTALLMSALLLVGDGVLRISVLLLTAFILVELYRAFGFTQKKTLMILGFIPLIFIFLFTDIKLSLCIYAYTLCLCIAYVFFHGDFSFRKIACVFFISVFVPLFMICIPLTECIPETGNFNVWLIFIGAWGSDLGAYLIGKNFGAHKFIPRISREKTLEGVLGGFLGPVIGFLIFGFIMSNCFGFRVNSYGLWGLALVTAVTAQLGDIFASAIKRERDIKDFAHLFPGFGGVLDMLDSVLLTAPAVYYFITYCPIIILR